MIDDHHHDTCRQQTANSITDQLLDNLPCDDASCDAYSNTPILSGYAASLLTNSTSTITPYHSGFVSFLPEQPQRPPLHIPL